MSVSAFGAALALVFLTGFEPSCNKITSSKNDLFKRLAEDKNIPVTEEFLNKLLENPQRFAGAASSQTEEFLKNKVKPVLNKYQDLIGSSNKEINV